MHVELEDKSIAKWAVDLGLLFYYSPEAGLPSPCLKVHLGMTTAYFHAGRLVKLTAASDACAVSELLDELSALFDFCVKAGARSLGDGPMERWTERLGHIAMGMRCLTCDDYPYSIRA